MTYLTDRGSAMPGPTWLVCVEEVPQISASGRVACPHGGWVDVDICRGCHLLVDMESDRLDGWCESVSDVPATTDWSIASGQRR